MSLFFAGDFLRPQWPPPDAYARSALFSHNPMAGTLWPQGLAFGNLVAGVLPPLRDGQLPAGAQG